MDWDLVAKYAVPTTGALAAVTVVPVFFWTNFRKAARRLAIIDVATKRIAFWNQFLSTVNLATSEGSRERKSQQIKAYDAISRIHSDALLQTEALVRTEKINSAITWHAFRPEHYRFKNWYNVLFWWWFAIMAALMLATGLLVFARLEYRVFDTNHPLGQSSLLLACGCILLFFALARVFLFKAESLKHDNPTPLIIDVI
jgi:hypothetical protein